MEQGFSLPYSPPNSFIFVKNKIKIKIVFKKGLGNISLLNGHLRTALCSVFLVHLEKNSIEQSFHYINVNYYRFSIYIYLRKLSA